MTVVFFKGLFMKRIFSGLFFILMIYSVCADAAEPKLVEKTFSIDRVQAEWEIYVPSLNIGSIQPG